MTHFLDMLKHNDVKRGGGVNIVFIIFQLNHFNEYLLWSLKYFVREKHNKNMIFKIITENI